MTDAPKPGDLLALAVTTARAAADLVAERRRHTVTVAATKSTETDPVTEADRASEALIRETILRERPEDSFLGEEGDDVVGSSGVRWIVDPIDGTVNFLYGIPRYAVSIAAEVDGVVVAGVVLDVPHGTLYAAFRQPDGTVASVRDGQPLRVRDEAPLSQRLVATGFSYDPGLRALQAEAMVRLLPQVRDIRRIGSAALDVCNVAEGVVDAYVEEGIHEWDYAAACLVAEGAGARWTVTTGVGGRRLLLVAPAHGFAQMWHASAGVGLLAADARPDVVPD